MVIRREHTCALRVCGEYSYCLCEPYHIGFELNPSCTFPSLFSQFNVLSMGQMPFFPSRWCLWLDYKDLPSMGIVSILEHVLIVSWASNQHFANKKSVVNLGITILLFKKLIVYNLFILLHAFVIAQYHFQSSVVAFRQRGTILNMNVCNILCHCKPHNATWSTRKKF